MTVVKEFVYAEKDRGDNEVAEKPSGKLNQILTTTQKSYILHLIAFKKISYLQTDYMSNKICPLVAIRPPQHCAVAFVAFSRSDKKTTTELVNQL